MKKYIFSVLMAAMAAFTFISCEDVPEPYTLPTQPGAPTTPEVATQGTEASPYTVTDAKTVKTGTGKYIKGYIVGYVPGMALNEAIFGDASSAETAPTNILLAAKADEKEVKNCMPIQLPAGDLRTALNLKDNSGNLKKELIICGNIETYFGATGLKSPVYAKIDGKEIGKKPGDTTPGSDLKGEAKGDGSEANPFNSVAAYNKAKALEADKVTDEIYYIKGKIQSIKYPFDAEHGTATVNIADDANSTTFLVYSVRYFGGEKWKEGDTQLNIGDEIVVSANLTNYLGTTPETKNATLISINGKTSAGGGEVKPNPTPDTPATGDAMNISSIVSGKTSSEDLPENAYGSQVAATESTWYSWKFDNIAYSGARICKANGDFTGTLQLQGNASDAAKQGFLFNSTAFSKDIKSITIVVKGLSKYDTPTVFGVYHGSSAHPTTDAIKGSYTKETGSTLNSFTFTYDFSSVSSKYFTIWNNAVGALYIEKIIITLK